MSDVSKLAMEAAEASVEQERAASVARVRAELEGPAGTTHCIHCETEIPEGRRQAMPTARDCIDCATGKEAGKR